MVVQRLQIESIVDESPDPYGQPGSSAIMTYVSSEDREAFEQLRAAADTGELVTVRCGALEVQGRVGRHQFMGKKMPDRIVIAVDLVRQLKAQESKR